mgnify:CR=1 FL=1
MTVMHVSDEALERIGQPTFDTGSILCPTPFQPGYTQNTHIPYCLLDVSDEAAVAASGLLILTSDSAPAAKGWPAAIHQWIRLLTRNGIRT